MNSRTFAEIYCERESLTSSELHTVLFLRTLYPRARLIAWLVRWLNPRHFLADYEFIEDVGHLRSLQDFSLALGSYVEHPSNWGLLRRRFRIRVSARRMLLVVRTVFSPVGQVQRTLRSDWDTLEPFGGYRPEEPASAPQTQDRPAAL